MLYTKLEILSLLLSNEDISKNWPIHWKFSYKEFLQVISKPSYSLAKDLNLRCDYVSKCLDIFWPDRLKIGSSKICTHILKIGGYKYCSKCDLCKTLELFGIAKNVSTGVSPYCKECSKNRSQNIRNTNPELSREHSRSNYLNHKEAYIRRNIERKLHTKLSTPSWANLDIIQRIYDCAETAHVDHIVPLRGELVCGLHVENNLQYLTPEENLSKGNKYSSLTEC